MFLIYFLKFKLQKDSKNTFILFYPNMIETVIVYNVALSVFSLFSSFCVSHIVTTELLRQRSIQNEDFRDTYYETTYLDESKRKPIQKTSRYFLGKVVNKKARIHLETQELKTFQWVSAEIAKKMMGYPEMRQLISYFEQ